MSDIDTDALSRYARDRDADAFAQLVDRHGPMVYATCLRRLGDEWGARDAAQETFVKLARSAEAIHGSVGAWLHRCATTTAVDLIRKDARRRRREAEAPARDAETLAPWDDVRVALDEALLELPDAARGLILQRYYQGRKLADLADEAGVSESLMSRRIKAAVDHLRDKLAIKGFGVTAAALTAGLAAESALAMPAGLAAGLTGVGLAGVGQASGGVTAGLLATTQAKLAAGLVLAAAIVGGGVTYQVLWPSNTAAVSAASTTVQPVANQRIIKVPWPELSQGDMQHNLVIRPDDVIRVPGPERIAELDLLANVTDVRPEDLLPSQAESRLQPGDRISVAIFELLDIGQDFRTEHTIDANGEIELFSLGVVKAAGMTATQLERQIAGRLQERELLRNAQVTVSLLSMPTYSVVTNQPIPGFFTGVSGIRRPDYRLLEAVELAGGLPEDTPIILVIRQEQQAGWRTVTLYDVEHQPYGVPVFIDYDTGNLFPITEGFREGGDEGARRFIEENGIDGGIDIAANRPAVLVNMHTYPPDDSSFVTASRFPVHTTAFTAAGNAYDVVLLSENREAGTLTLRYRPAERNAPPAGAAGPPPGVVALPEEVQGVWAGVEIGDPGVRRVTEIAGHRISYRRDDGLELYEADIVEIDLDADPKRFVAVIREAIVDDLVGRRVPAVWLVDGDGEDRALMYASFGPGAEGFPDDVAPGGGARAFRFSLQPAEP